MVEWSLGTRTARIPATQKEESATKVTASRNSSKPTNQELQNAADKSICDVIAPGLHLLFCGINPGLYSAYTGYHFARPGNRFWQTLYTAGFTPTRLTPSRQDALLDIGIGLTNLVERASASARTLKRAELVTGGERFIDRVELLRPRAVAILGIGAYRRAFSEPDAAIGRQMPGLGPAPLWVLPNPSGANAHYPPPILTKVFRDFRRELEKLYIWP
jgi:TDG/mug DNA glycosylase family protein